MVGLGRVESVNVGRPEPGANGRPPVTGIHKRPTTDPVEVRDPGPRRGGLGSGLVGDHVHDWRHHGGTDQAVYAVAREELDYWSAQLGRRLPNGAFGENLTTAGVDVDACPVGQIWRVGHRVRLQVAGPRIPCATFVEVMQEPRWARRFTEHGRTGAYLRVLTAGRVRSGDHVVVEDTPGHGVTVAVMFRALTTQRELMPVLEAVDTLGAEGRRKLAAWRAGQPGQP